MWDFRVNELPNGNLLAYLGGEAGEVYYRVHCRDGVHSACHQCLAPFYDW